MGSLLTALLLSSSAFSQTRQQVMVGYDIPGDVAEICGTTMKPEPLATSDAEILVELVGLPNVSKLNAQRLRIRRAPGLNNACARPEPGGTTIIAYDPNWASGDTPGFYLTLGHEAGHHFCGHFLDNAQGTWSEKELEADRFGGAAIKRFEVYHNRSFFNQVYAAAMAKYPEQGSILYPPRAARLNALKLGYEQGSPCGDLAPVEQEGFDPGSRTTGPAGPCRPVRTGPTSYGCAR